MRTHTDLRDYGWDRGREKSIWLFYYILLFYVTCAAHALHPVGTSCCKFLFQTDQEEPDEDKELLKVADPQEAKELKDRIARMLWVGDISVWRWLKMWLLRFEVQSLTKDWTFQSWPLYHRFEMENKERSIVFNLADLNFEARYLYDSIYFYMYVCAIYIYTLHIYIYKNTHCVPWCMMIHVYWQIQV